ncbi:MAG: aminotransferase class I/II-fold pyridoxal phosphate-dependent enzyme [Labilithrix sp.]|nr:aminotransferase class I/II-fold pyridoxal phosphate-dependent enzyme [Labilithrix sp.]MCW5815877.1 aminotransferase class I/II-fold pyridoxal phosphate-dependent enzyme [Labilithrix sp.]
MIDPALDYAVQLRRRADAIATLAVHAGEDPAGDGALDPAIVMSSAFAFQSTEHAARAFRGEEDAWIYGRWGNPTVTALEAKLAAIEGAESACATASGMAAISGAILALCEAGDHVVAPRSMYAESARLLRERLPRLGITTTFVDGDAAAYAAAITDKTKLLYVETPANPTLAVVDLPAVVALARDRGARVLADGTFATPFAQTPLAHGVDLVVHSVTKGLGGHGDVIAGAVLGARAMVDRVRDTVIKGFGGILAPHSAWLVARGLRTFALRQERACATAASLARTLASHPAVAIVHHPSLPSHPGHALACKQMHAFGALLSFELRGGLDAGRRALERLKVATHAVSLGDVRTLAIHPASTTHSTMPAETRRLAGIGDGLIRVSVGIESELELIRDFGQALE